MSQDYKANIHLPETAFAMKADLANREPKILAQWEANDLYGRIQSHTANRPTYVLHDGPPYANGSIHIGHAVNKILKDIIVKSKLLAGFRAPYVPGWDCHGLPIEIAVEKKVGKVGQKISAREFRAACRAYASEQIDGQRADFKRLGVLGAWDKPYRTMDFQFEADMIRALARIVENGHLARGSKPVHWCFDCGSALAEAEIEYADKTSPAIDVAFDAVDPDAFAKIFALDRGDAVISIPIWTTTPWTLPANLAVSLNAELEYVLIEGPARNGKPVFLVIAEALADVCAMRYMNINAKIVGRVLGAKLELQKLQHPFIDRVVPVILGEHVAADAGTGAVHTAPGHGQEDFIVGQKYNIGVLNPVGGNGVFLPDTPIFAGQFIWKANDTVIAELQSRGVLLASEKIHHSYPHCWRHKTPVAFRATPQWFISMQQAGLRNDALNAIKQVQWMPDWGQARITSMIENRPDWCISRQRTWGVPIALFIDKDTNEQHPRSVQLMREVAKLVEQEGVDAWYELDAKTLLGNEAEQYVKVTDILDVWFDSGVTHACVIEARDELSHAKNDVRGVMYLEGSDQHRGWFHSSLLTGCALDHKAPYTEVITHGFTVDAQGRKMSKSMGNVVAPQDVMKTLGADILRLWVAATDYSNEMSVSDEILKRVADSYRRLRNTARFLLGNLNNFDPQKSAIAFEHMLLLDRWALSQAIKLMQLARNVFGEEANRKNESGLRYSYQTLVQELMRFCTVDMGSAYLDITKDRLYTMQENAPARRSAQTAMYWICEILVRAFAPIMSFTADEIWQLLPNRKFDSTLFTTWAELDELASLNLLSAEENADLEILFGLRDDVNLQIETQRNGKALGGSMEANVSMHCTDQAQLAQIKKYQAELRFFFIVGNANVVSSHDELPDSLRASNLNMLEKKDIKMASRNWVLTVERSTSPKCIRCYQHRADVGENKNHPEICLRCVDNVDGYGEQRSWF